MSIKLPIINSCQKDEKFEITLNETDTVKDLKLQIFKLSVYFSELSMSRIGFFFYMEKPQCVKEQEQTSNLRKKSFIDLLNVIKVKIPNDNSLVILKAFPYLVQLSEQNHTLFTNSESNKIKPKFILYLTDLGIQIPTVYANFVEYSMPAVLTAVFMFYIHDYNYLYNYQIVTGLMIMFHYIKRVFETLYIHIQINTMELRMFIIECIYYIGFFGIVVQSYLFMDGANVQVTIFKIIIFNIFIFSELNNFACHMILRKIRIPNKFNREIPRGNLFEYVYCANYFWEICSWLSISLFCEAISMFIFCILGAVIMSCWAVEKKIKYEKRFKPAISNKKAIIPYIL